MDPIARYGTLSQWQSDLSPIPTLPISMGNGNIAVGYQPVNGIELAAFVLVWGVTQGVRIPCAGG